MTVTVADGDEAENQRYRDNQLGDERWILAKRKSFEKILETEFRWPRANDRPFVVADQPQNNANIPADDRIRLAGMTEGYKKAADLMVAQAEADATTRNFLVYPIIFNYRHFVELSLKYHLAIYGPTVGIKPNWTSHDLAILWSAFLEMLDRFGTKDPDEVDPIVGETILAFAKIDPGSYSYRYPVDRLGNPVPVEQADLHLPTLADVMNGVAGYFSGTDGYLSDVINV